MKTPFNESNSVTVALNTYDKLSCSEMFTAKAIFDEAFKKEFNKSIAGTAETPLTASKWAFYAAIGFVYYAGVIAGKQQDRARRKGH